MRNIVLRTMKSCNNGLTFMELVIGMSILFLVGIMLLELFVVSSRHSIRAKEHSTCVLLAQSKMESTLFLPKEQMHSITEPVPFSDKFSQYLYTVELSDYDSDFWLLRVTAIAPSGTKAQMTTLYRPIAQ